MKKFLLFSLLVGLFGGSQAQDLKPIKLNQPNVKRGLPVMTALQKRQSTREYADKKLELQDLSDLLWAAAGINRPESGKRTSPTAMNKQEIDVYVCLQEGAYLYHPKANSLEPVTKEDLRPAVGGGQGFVATAPVRRRGFNACPGCRYCFPEYILVLFRHRLSDSPQSLYGSGKIEEWFEIERYSTAFDQSSGGICKMIKEKLLCTL